MNNNGSWFHRFISLDEMKSSSIVISFLVFSGIAIYMLIKHGEIPQNLTTLLSIQIGVIGGVNCFNYVSNNLSMNRNNGQMPMQNNMYGSSYNPYSNSNMYGSNYNSMNNTMMNNSMNQNIQQPIQSTVNQPVVQNIVRPQDRKV